MIAPGTGGGVSVAACGLDLPCSTMVMATGIVSAALGQAGAGVHIVAFATACAMLGNGLADDGHRYAARELAGAALAAWLALTCVNTSPAGRPGPGLAGHHSGEPYLVRVGLNCPCA